MKIMENLWHGTRNWKVADLDYQTMVNIHTRERWWSALPTRLNMITTVLRVKHLVTARELHFFTLDNIKNIDQKCSSPYCHWYHVIL